MKKLKDWIWDKLFLDFYLDPGWTFRFKLMNLISGDALREYLTHAHYHLTRITDAELEGQPLKLHVNRTKHWVYAAWNAWRN